MVKNSKGKWSIKDSEKYITYKRVIDLRQEDIEVLKRYDLKKAKYIYVGQCREDKIDARHSKFIWDIKNRTTNNKNVHFELDTAITYQNIISYCKEQKQMTQDEVENYLFRSKECFIVEYEGLTKDESLKQEKNIYHSYLVDSKFTNEIVLLQNRDSQLKDNKNSINLKKGRKKDEFNSVEMQLIYRSGKCYLKFNDIEHEMNQLKFVPSVENNDIIGLENNKKALNATNI